MNKNIEKELIGVSGGVPVEVAGYASYHVELKRQKERQAQEMRRLEGLADIRRRAGEDALRAAMRVQHGEMEIKAAQRAAMGL